jgi:hypothetical protein
MENRTKVVYTTAEAGGEKASGRGYDRGYRMMRGYFFLAA